MTQSLAEHIAALPFEVIFQYCYDFSKGANLRSIILGSCPEYHVRTAQERFDLPHFQKLCLKFYLFPSKVELKGQLDNLKKTINDLFNNYYNYLEGKYRVHFLVFNSLGLSGFTRLGLICMMTGSIQLHLSSIESYLRRFSVYLRKSRAYGGTPPPLEEMANLINGSQLILRAMKHMESIVVHGKRGLTERNPSIGFYLEYYILSSSLIYEKGKEPTTELFKGYYCLSPVMIELFLSVNPKRETLMNALKSRRDHLYNANPTLDVYYLEMNRICEELLAFFRPPARTNSPLVEFILYDCYPLFITNKLSKTSTDSLRDLINILKDKKYTSVSSSSSYGERMVALVLKYLKTLVARAQKESSASSSSSTLKTISRVYDFPDFTFFQGWRARDQEMEIEKLEEFIERLH
jgi:hypothetical protein